MKAGRARQPWRQLRVHEGGVKVAPPRADERELLRTRLIDQWVVEYDAALAAADNVTAARVAAGLRSLGVRV